ncbi:class I SAM-dependent methyltransferase [Pantoea dispersa]|nr:class I SAM-dependent methyltransferase [Pantoea dispersa]
MFIAHFNNELIMMNDLKALYIQHKGKSSDKWNIYLDVYERILSGRRDKISNVLEIGVQNGGSLEIWSEYFPFAKNLIGCDINPECAKLKYNNPAVQIIIGNSSAPEVKDEVVSKTSCFDLIIDDGSHTSSDIIKGFLQYFPLVSDGGVYIIEDLHASYWETFEGGLHYPYSSMAFLKKLADVTNYEHWGIEQSPKDYLSPFFEFYNCKEMDVVDYHGIHSVCFVNSLCIIEKKKMEENILGPRYVTGDEWSVFSNNKESQGLNIKCIPQNKNIWSTLKTFPEMEWRALVDEKQILERKILSLKQESDAYAIEMQEKTREFSAVLSEKEQRLDNLSETNLQLLNSTSWKLTRPLRVVMSMLKRK